MVAATTRTKGLQAGDEDDDDEDTEAFKRRKDTAFPLAQIRDIFKPAQYDPGEKIGPSPSCQSCDCPTHTVAHGINRHPREAPPVVEIKRMLIIMK